MSVRSTNFPEPTSADTAARALLDWLAVRDVTPPVSGAVIGFGHFDLGIPRHCARLFQERAARHIIFTGGIGAGTADLGQPEADAFLALLAAEFPAIRPEEVITENRSTNTAENIAFTESLLRRDHPELLFGKGLRSVLLVANPCRQRRVWLTWKHLLPEVAACNSPAPFGYDEQQQLYASKRQSFARQLLGEFDRLRDYPARGWIAPCVIPAPISTAAEVLRGALEDPS